MLRPQPRRVVLIRVGDDRDGLEVGLRLAVWRWPEGVDLWLQHVGEAPETRMLLARLARAWGAVLLDPDAEPPPGARVWDWQELEGPRG